MVNVTIFCADGTKQVINMTDAVLIGDKGKELAPDELKLKLANSARSIVGASYVKHKVVVS